MANIIIRPEHQSAPKVPQAKRIKVANPDTRRELPVHRGDSDVMDLPAVTENLSDCVMDKSPEWTVESALEQFEKNMNSEDVKAQRWKGQERWQGKENEEMRLVKIIHPHTFIDMLRRAGIAATRDADRECSPRNSRIWLNDFVRAGRVGVNAWIYDAVEGRRVAKTITTLQYPFGPEYSIMRFNEYNVPTAEKYRGWRTALLALIVKEVISEEEAVKAFGLPLGPASTFYKEQLFKFRNRRLLQ